MTIINGTITGCINDIQRIVRAHEWNTEAVIDEQTINMAVSQDYSLNIPSGIEYYLVSLPAATGDAASGRQILTSGYQVAP